MKSLLIIEDDPDMRMLAERILEESPYEVSAANDAEDGLRLIRTHYPDLVLLDINLPGKDGLYVLRQIKSSEAFRDVAILMMTADSSRLTVKIAIERGAVDYIVKPINKERMLNKIKRASMVQDMARETTTSSKDARVEVKRKPGVALFSFYGMIGGSTIDQVSAQLSARFLENTARDRYVLDLRYQPFITTGQQEIMKQVVATLGSRKPLMLAGRNYTALLELDIDVESQLFIGEDDLENFIGHSI